jgi:putative salt-induced outer membrane protein YdiY
MAQCFLLLLSGLFMVFTATVVHADTPVQVTVVLSNGDRLSGSLVDETSTSVTIDHVVLGRITLPRTISSAPPSDVPQEATTAQGEAAPVLVSKVETPPTSPWTGKVGLSLNYTSNEQTSADVRLSGEVHKKTMLETFALNGWFLMQYTNGDLTQSKAFVDVSQNWLSQDSPWLTFVEGQYLYNTNEAWEHQVSPNAGYGYRVYDTEAYALTLKGGGGVRWQYKTDTLDPQLYFRADGRVKVSPTQSLHGFVQATPALNDFGNTQGIVQLNYTIQMDVGVPMAFKFFLQNNFETQPQAGSNHNDLTAGIGVDYSF